MIHCAADSTTKTDTTKYIGSLTGICKRCGKSVLFLENVAYCKSKTLKEFLAKMGDTIKVICFSLHTPDLSPEGAMGDAQKNTLKLSCTKISMICKSPYVPRCGEKRFRL